jgi:rubrerythrin
VGPPGYGSGGRFLSQLRDSEDVMARRDRKSGPERTAHWVEVLRQWQGIERDAIETTSQIMEKTDSLLIRQLMEIIRNDSVQHHRVQQFIIDSMTKAAVTMTPEDLAEVWGQIEAHDELERQTIELAEELLEDSTEPVQQILLKYLLVDEQKHDQILGELEEFKKYMAKIS